MVTEEEEDELTFVKNILLLDILLLGALCTLLRLLLITLYDRYLNLYFVF